MKQKKRVLLISIWMDVDPQRCLLFYVFLLLRNRRICLYCLLLCFYLFIYLIIWILGNKKKKSNLGCSCHCLFVVWFVSYLHLPAIRCQNNKVVQSDPSRTRRLKSKKQNKTPFSFFNFLSFFGFSFFFIFLCPFTSIFFHWLPHELQG